MAAEFDPSRTEEFVDTLVNTGFLEKRENGYVIHDWNEYSGRLFLKVEAKREKDRLRIAAWRKAKRNAAETQTSQKSRQVEEVEEEEEVKEVKEVKEGEENILRNSDCEREAIAVRAPDPKDKKITPRREHIALPEGVRHGALPRWGFVAHAEADSICCEIQDK